MRTLYDALTQSGHAEPPIVQRVKRGDRNKALLDTAFSPPFVPCLSIHKQSHIQVGVSSTKIAVVAGPRIAQLRCIVFF